MRSSTSVGVSVVWVEFDWGTDIYTARQVVAEKLQLVGPSLPPEIEPPVLAPISSIMGEILFIGLVSEDTPPEQLRTLADWEVRRRLLSVPGVSQVVPIGGGVQQFVVQVRPEALGAHGVTLDDVVDAVAATNENTSAGFYEQGGQEYLIYGLGRVSGAEDIAEAVVAMHPKGPVLVSDVGDVVLGTAIKRGDASINGSPAVVLGIQKQPGVNTLAVTEQIDEVLDDVEGGLPPGVRLERQLLRQADFIDNSVDNVSIALRDGSILVILIIGLFLLSGRATLITALGDSLVARGVGARARRDGCQPQHDDAGRYGHRGRCAGGRRDHRRRERRQTSSASRRDRRAARRRWRWSFRPARRFVARSSLRP